MSAVSSSFIKSHIRFIGPIPIPTRGFSHPRSFLPLLSSSPPYPCLQYDDTIFSLSLTRNLQRRQRRYSTDCLIHQLTKNAKYILGLREAYLSTKARNGGMIVTSLLLFFPSPSQARQSARRNQQIYTTPNAQNPSSCY